VVFSRDGQLLTTTSWHGTAQVLDPATGNCLHTITDPNEIVDDVAFSPDGWQPATASVDKTVRLWDQAAASRMRLQPRIVIG